MSIIPDQLSEHTKATLSRAPHFAEGIDRDFDKIKWFKGHIKKGYGAHEDGDCYVAWHKKCALTVVATPREHRKYREPGEPIFAYSFHFSVGGHFSGSSATLAGAIQEAALAAIKLDGDSSDSDCQWLRGKGGKKGFFEFHRVDIEHDTPLTFADLATEENLRPIPVLEGPYATEEQTPAPRM